MDKKAFALSGRTYNALSKFCGKGKFSSLIYSDGKVYATDGYAIARWTPSENMDNRLRVNDAPGTDCYADFATFHARVTSIPAGTTVYLDYLTCDIDLDKRAFALNVAKLFDKEAAKEKYRDKDSKPGHMGIDIKYLAKVTALGKAIHADKCGSNGTPLFDPFCFEKGGPMFMTINTATNGVFEVAVMPVIMK